MAGIWEPVPPASACELVAWIAPNEQSGLSNAMHAETLEGDVDHRVAIGLSGKAAPIFVAREEKQVALIEDAPPWIAGYCLASFHLIDWTQSVIRWRVDVGIVAEKIAHCLGSKPVAPPVVLDRVAILTRNQLAIANQADRAVTLKG